MQKSKAPETVAKPRSLNMKYNDGGIRKDKSIWALPTESNGWFYFILSVINEIEKSNWKNCLEFTNPPGIIFQHKIFACQGPHIWSTSVIQISANLGTINTQLMHFCNSRYVRAEKHSATKENKLTK